MSWPSRDTRRIHLDRTEYLWHLSGNRIDKTAHVTVGTELGKHYLFLDPYAHDLEISPSSIRDAIQWALNAGWSADDGPTRYLAYSTENREFFWLPEGVRFAYEMENTMLRRLDL